MHRIRYLLLSFTLLAAPAYGQEVRSEVRVLSNNTGIVHVSQRFVAVGAKWESGSVPNLLLRASRNGVTWSDWVRAELDPDAPAALPSASLVFFDWDSTWLEYKKDPASGAVQVLLIDPGRTPSDRLKGMKGRLRDRAVLARPPLVSRLDWACPDGEHAREAVQYTTVTHLIVHHTGDSFPSNDYPAWVRAIWTYHVFSNGWIDIGYNYVIDPDGTVYEGRAGGDNVLGAHFSCQNSGTMGVALLGTYTTTIPSAAALKSLEALLAWKANQLQIDPLGQALHKGSGLNLYRISGHRDGNNSPTTCTVTECPGDDFYPMLPSVRSATAGLIAQATVPLLSEDAESGGTGWVATGLWHVSSKRSYSASHSWWYGREDTGNYETPGYANSGSLESPAFQVNGPATLTFRSWFATEDGGVWDRKTVELQVNGGDWTVLDVIGGDQQQWVSKSYPVNVTGSVKIRFRFDTVDSSFNETEGWYLDDIRVSY